MNGSRVSFSPCGMAMDVLRSAKRAKMRFDPNRPDLLTDVEWFFCQPGAKVFPGPHRFANSVWDSEHTQADQSLGETWQEFYPWANGVAPAVATGQDFCGDLTKFQNGVDLVNDPLVDRDAFGLPTCCGGTFLPYDADYIALEDGTPILLEADADFIFRE
jgi:hypothetical protein